MKTHFIKNDGGKNPAIVAEGEIHFDEGPLAGTKLVGFAIRKSDTGGTYVTLPGRAYGMGDERGYFDFLRANTKEHGAGRATMLRLKEWIRAEWKRVRDEA